MTILNFSHRFIFVHVPKSAGTSVTSMLSQFTRLGDVELGATQFGEILARAYGPRFGIRKHSTAREIRQAVGEDVWAQQFKFAFVRNPYARAFSIYTFLKTKFRDWPGNEIMDGFANFDAFVASDFFTTDGPDRVLRPQLFWLRTSLDDETPMVDFVGRVESIDEDVGQILRRVETGEAAPMTGPVPRANASSELDAWRQEYQSELTRQRVYRRYERDFVVFGYSPRAVGRDHPPLGA